MREMTLEERKKMLLQIMDFIDDFCKKNNLRYFLTGGTLLGAVRHKGFIPWDDDIDIAMPRNDYENFVCIFNKEKCINSLKFISEKNVRGYYLPFGKVINTETLLIENVARPVNLGVNVDVFPLDLLGYDLNNARKHNIHVGRYRKLLDYTKIKFGKDKNFKKTILRNIAACFSYMIPRFFIIKKISMLAKKYIEIIDSTYVAIIVMMTYGEKEIMERKWFDDVVKVEFEGRMYNAPANYHEVLTHFYKDYMQLPPVEKRVTHHSNKAWWRE